VIRVALPGLALGLLASAAVAQPADPHAGHVMSAAPKAAAPEAAAPDPHAGHVMPAAPAAATPADPHAGHAMPPPDPHAGHAMPPAPGATQRTGADLPVGDALAPAPARDDLADAVFGRGPMAAARGVLRGEHGGAVLSRTMIDTLEVRPDRGPDGYAWEGEFRYGGDIDRLVLKSEGEGAFGEHLEQAEVQALWSHAVGPYFDVQVGVRQDFQPRPRRTYATLGFEGLAPYWFEVEGALFLSNKGDLSARLEGAYDLRITQRLILEPRAEVNLAAQDVPELGEGAGLTDAEVGLRLRYEIRREFAPYVGVHYERKFGDTADLARASGEGVDDLRVVVGLRAWF